MFSSKSKQIRLLSTSGSNSNTISGNVNNNISGSNPNLNSNFTNNTTNSNHKSDDSAIYKSSNSSSGSCAAKLSLSSENVRKNSIESISGNNTKPSPSKLPSDKCNSNDQKNCNASNNSSSNSSSSGGLSYFSPGNFTRIFKSSASFVQNPFNISSYSNSSNSSNSNSNSNSPSNNKATSNSTTNSQSQNNEIISNKSVPTTKSISVSLSSSKISTTTNTVSATTATTTKTTSGPNNSKAIPLAISNSQSQSAIKSQNDRQQQPQSNQKSSTFLKAFSNSTNNSIVVSGGSVNNDSNESLKIPKNSKDLNNGLNNSIGHKNSENIFKTIKKTGTGILSPEDKKLTTSSSSSLASTKSQQANFSTTTTTNQKAVATSNTTNLTRNGSIPKKDTLSSSSSSSTVTSVPSTKSSTKSKSSGNDLIRISSASDMFKTVGDLVGKRSKKSNSLSSSSGTSITKTTTATNINSKNTDSKNVIISSTATSIAQINNSNLIIPNGYPGQKISKDSNINTSKSIVQNNNSKSASPFFKPITQAIKRIDNNNSTTVTTPSQFTSSASSSTTLSLTMNNGNVQGMKSLHINKTQMNELSPSGIPVNTSKISVKLNEKTSSSGAYNMYNKKSPSSEQQQKPSDFRSKYKSPLDMSIILPETISSDLNDNSINFDNDHEVEQTIDRVEEVLAAMESSARLSGNGIVNNTDSPLMNRFLSPTNDLNRPQHQQQLQPVTSTSIALQQFQQYQSLKNPPSVLLSQQQQQQHHQTATVSPFNFTTTITKTATLSCSDINELEEKVSSAISSEVACLKIVESVDDIASNPIVKLRKPSSHTCSTAQQQRNLNNQILKQINTSIENNNYTTTPPPPPAPSGQPQQQTSSSFISYIIASTTDLPDIEEEDVLTDSPNTPTSTNTVVGSSGSVGGITGNYSSKTNNISNNNNNNDDDEFYSTSNRNPFNNLGQTLRYPSHSNLTAVEKYPDLRKLASSSTVSDASESPSSSSPSLIQLSNFDANRTKTFNSSGSPFMSSEDIRKKIQLESSANALYYTLTLKKNKQQQQQQHPIPPDSLDLTNINSASYNYENHLKNLSEINKSASLTVGCNNIEMDDNGIGFGGIGGTGSTFNDILSDSIVETPELNSNALQFGSNICNGGVGGIFSSGGILTSATGTTTTPSSITSNFRFNGNNDISVNNINNNVSNCNNNSNNNINGSNKNICNSILNSANCGGSCSINNIGNNGGGSIIIFGNQNQCKIPSHVMNAVQLFLVEHGNEYIRQFLQVSVI